MTNTNTAEDKQNFFKYNGWSQAEKTITFAGGTLNDPGDFDGTGNPFNIFTVTGVVKIRFLALCTVSLAGATATLKVGTAKLDTGLIALTTATNIAINEIWHDATPDSSVELMYESAIATNTLLFPTVVAQNIIGTVGTANITSGAIKFICLWTPVSVDGNVMPA